MCARGTILLALAALLASAFVPCVGAQGTAPRATAVARTLDIYIADTEGGKAALYVSPSGGTVLIDTGNPGARDGDRIMAMLEAAGVRRIDHLVSTHYHRDHVGGLVALAQRIPIAHYVDHGPNVEIPEQVSGFRAAYDSILAKAKHTVVKPGDRLAVAGLDWRIVQSAGRSITSPLPGTGAGAPNGAACASFERKPDPARPDDNAQSVGSVITFGRFRVLDLGDLLWNEEHDLVCPRNLIGAVDLYMVSHHGLASSGSTQLVHSVRPRVAVMQNGTRKGGAPATFQTLLASPGLEDVWTLHWSYAAGVEHNSPGLFIANLDSTSTIASVLTAAPGQRGGTNEAHAPAHYIRISARADGSFTVTNTRNGFSKTYTKR
jgi:beta-lactamase superfamily II metal-dependent hydrolase